MSQHDFSAVASALEAAAAERRTALDLIVAASDRVSKMADVQGRVEEAPSRVATFIGHGKRALWFAAALSVTLIASGIAVRIAHPAFSGEALPEKLATIMPPPRSLPDVRTAPNPEEEPDVVNYTIFRERTVNAVLLTAGHKYLEAGDQVWDNAWCYTNLPGPNGETVWVTLANRDAPDASIVYPQDPSGWAAVKMNAEIARVLGESCPWIEPYVA